MRGSIYFMDIPRFWRLSAPMKGFRAQAVYGENDQPQVLRIPGGEIPLSGDLEEVHARLAQKGFKEEIIDEMLFDIFGAVPTETTVAGGESIESVLKFLRSEVGEEDRSKVELSVNRLPR